MILSLIRHGMTEANEKRLYCGRTDVPLSDQGRARLTELKETVAYPTASLYVSSGLTRADESLRILYNREQDITMPEFMEMDFGEFEMKNHDELMDRPEYRRWIDDLDKGATDAGGADGGGGTTVAGGPSAGKTAACPGGESVGEFHLRIYAGIEKLRGTDAESAIVICHGGVIMTIMNYLFPGRKKMYEWQPAHGRGYTINIDGAVAAPTLADAGEKVSPPVNTGTEASLAKIGVKASPPVDI